MCQEATTWEEDSLSDQELRQAIIASKTQGMELELAELLKKLQPTEEYKRDCQRALLLLRAACAQEFQTGLGKGASLEIIGSCAQGTELNGSDLDVACRVSGFSPEEVDAKLPRLWARLGTLPHSTHLVALDSTRLFPHAKCMLSASLKASAQGPAPRFHAHLLLVWSTPVKQSLDSMLCSLCDCCGKARDLIRLVKLWAMNHGLADHREGYMNGVAWTALVLCFLQRENYLPPLQTLLERGNWKGSQTPIPSLMDLLLRFFQYVCALQAATPSGISLMEGNDCEAPPAQADAARPPPPLYIQDPVQLTQGSDENIASMLGETQWARILDESRRVAERLDPSKPKRWFYWAEIFDPQGLASGGNKRLPKLGEVKVPFGDETASLDNATHATSSSTVAAAQAARGANAGQVNAQNTDAQISPTSEPLEKSALVQEVWSGGSGWPPGKGPAAQYVPHAY